MKKYNRTKLKRHDKTTKFPPKKWRRRKRDASTAPARGQSSLLDDNKDS